MKRFLKYLFIFIFAFILWNVCNNVKANSISKISMDIYINNNGDATVTEVWKCNVNSGTEVYHPYYNLGNSKITNLSVRNSSSTYTTLDYWNTSASFDNKAYKCGINRVSDGVELCWGISKYGFQTYTVTYTITNFVSSLTDSQMIYWTLIPYDFSNSIGSVYIKIYTDFDISDSVGVWGYGDYGAPAYVYDGYIEMQSNGALSTDEYMTILVQFPKDTFNAKNYINHDFNYYLKMAEKNSVKYKSNQLNPIIPLIMCFVFFIFLIIWTLLPFFIIINSGTKFNFGESGKRISKDVDYYRDIPCNGDIFKAYYIAYTYGLIKNKTDILGAIILKWIKDDIVQVEQREKDSSLKKKETVIILNNVNPILSISNVKEKQLFNMLVEASKDGILEDKEFENWCKNSYSTILNWFDDILKIERDKLVEKGFILVESKKFLFTSSLKYTATSQLKKEALKIAGLKRFLNDYSLIGKREPIEVKLFEEYLVYAQMMGIAKKVAKDFKDLYPDVIMESKFTNYDNIIFINNYSSRGISTAHSAKASAEARARASSYSSGGGGFSSGGGGGGSFGGGHGGGGFR